MLILPVRLAPSLCGLWVPDDHGPRMMTGVRCGVCCAVCGVVYGVRCVMCDVRCVTPHRKRRNGKKWSAVCFASRSSRNSAARVGTSPCAN